MAKKKTETVTEEVVKEKVKVEEANEVLKIYKSVIGMIFLL